MDNTDVTSTMQEMMAEMAAMRAELTDLKSRANGLTQLQPQPVQQINPLAATTRRKALRKIGGGVMAASLGASLPIFTTSAAPELQLPPPADPNGSAGPISGASINGVNPNVTPNLAADGSVTQTIIGYDFKPSSSGSTYSYGQFGGIYWTGTGDSGFWYRLDLPHGAKITNVTFFFTDTTASYDLRMSLGMNNPLTHSFTYPVTLTSTGAPGESTLSANGTAAAPLLTIDNSLYSYELLAIFSAGDSSTVLWGARVTYVNILGRFKAA